MPSNPIHPGEILKGELKILGISATKLARTINVPANRVSQIISGKRGITADTALRLGQAFRTGPHFWLNLQVAYELDLASGPCNCDLTAIVPLVEPIPS